MRDETHPIVNLTHDDMEALLRRAIRITLILGVLACSGVVLIARAGGMGRC